MDLTELKSRFVSFSDSPLSKGGQKIVYSAVHPSYGDVVVKRIDDPDERIDREIDIVRSNSFANVPQIFEVLNVEWDGKLALVIVEEKVEGLSLRQIITSGDRYGLSQTLDFLEQGLNFVKAISLQNIVHRDIKPENIIRDSKMQYHYLDFGIARDLSSESLTQTGYGPNTPGYAAPEVFLGDKDQIDQRSDLFSFGVVAYELIAGVNPFRKNDENPLMAYVNTLTRSPTDLRIVGDRHFELRALIKSMMSKDRFKRPRDAEEALGWLKTVRININMVS